MKLAGHIRPVALAVLLASALFPLACGTPASAQEFLGDWGGFDYRVAAFSGFPVYSVGFSQRLSPRLNAPPIYLVISDSFQPTGGVTGNLLDVGIYYTRLYPKTSISLGVGFASEFGPFPGFGFVNASGYSVGARAQIQLTNDLFGYANGRFVSLGGTSNSVVDLGLQLGVLELGYISFAGSGAPYLGLNLPFICLFFLSGC